MSSGKSIAVTNNHIIIGASFNDEQANDAGAVYVYDINDLSASPDKLMGSDISTQAKWGCLFRTICSSN